jgi:hypothetical protein
MIVEPIKQIEQRLKIEHEKLFKLFATNEPERDCILSALLCAYLSGQAEALTSRPAEKRSADKSVVTFAVCIAGFLFGSAFGTFLTACNTIYQLKSQLGFIGEAIPWANVFMAITPFALGWSLVLALAAVAIYAAIEGGVFLFRLAGRASARDASASRESQVPSKPGA